MAPLSNVPSTFILDAKQYLIIDAGDCRYALTLAGKP